VSEVATGELAVLNASRTVMLPNAVVDVEEPGGDTAVYIAGAIVREREAVEAGHAAPLTSALVSDAKEAEVEMVTEATLASIVTVYAVTAGENVVGLPSTPADIVSAESVVGGARRTVTV
jgi:hypothetical protein